MSWTQPLKVLVFCGVSLGAAMSLSADILIEGARASLIDDVRLPAREAGVLEVLSVREGTEVAVGDSIGFIDRSMALLQGDVASIQLEVAQAEADSDVELRFARKSSQVSYAELDRFEEAVRAYAKAVSESELDTARFSAERADMSVEQAEKDRKIAELTSQLRARERDVAMTRIGHAKLVSPLRGTIVEVLVQPGEWAQTGQPIVRIIGLDRLRIEAFVDAKQSDEGLVDCSVEFKPAEPTGQAGTFPGKIVFVSPEVDAVTGQVRIWAEVDNKQRKLRPGFKGDLVIRTQPASRSEPKDSADPDVLRGPRL